MLAVMVYIAPARRTTPPNGSTTTFARERPFINKKIGVD
jgi:hypothetical protein